ncbi:WD40 repeat-like protein [Penicillium chermesinum]|uniref:WD40 repeat-like protein n=1 Tax=Penicillium chermesinum TaxID=63820 RepID=A0A9W9NST9_9EURO|nr:WD40 repeat-like protein [Penicillium chermesinum]KAJ5225449.1 WD40 repeat-like protein [Penicillium chermesinum]
MLLCGIIDEISDAGQYLVSYFFCQETDSRLNKATNILRGLIYMLIDQNPALISHVRGRYDELGKQLFEGINSWHALSNIFVDILDELDHVHSTVYLIIDALDECTNGLFELLELITENVSRFPHVKWLLSSRIWPEITERLHLVPDKSRITLELDETSVAGAVKTFIDIKVSELAKLKNYTQQVFDAVYSCLISHAQGTFLWVALVCERLARVSRMRTIEMLTAFPPGLDALYNRMMQQVLEHDEAPLCRQILEVASLVYRPLTLHELPTFIDLPTHVNENDHGLLEEIIEYCGSFLTISESTILFVHNSAKDYLLEHAQSDVLPTGKDQGHIAIFLRSLEVMEVTLKRDLYNTGFAGLSIRPMDVPRPTSDPLVKARYACMNWTEHLSDYTSLRPSSGTSGDELWRTKLKCFIATKFLYWLEALSYLGSISTGLNGIMCLDQICQRSPDENLASQLADASRFIQYHQPAIESSPLQAYCSSLLFSPTGSEVQRNFLGEMADWVTINPSIQTWNPCVQTLEGHSSPVMSLEWSPDLTMIASFSYDSICIWNPQTRQCILRLEGHTSDIKATAWSPDGKLLASSSVDCTLRVWDMETGQCTLILENHKDPISAIYWSSDGNRLVSVSGIRHVYEPVPMVIKTWSRETGHCELTLEDEKPDAHVFPSYPRVFPSSDGKFLISTTPEGGMRTWQPLGHKMTLASTKHKMSRSPWIWTDDRKHVMYSVPSTGHVKVLDASTLPYSTIFELEHPDVRVIALSLDELSLASASGRKSLTRIKIWSLITGQCISSFDEKSVVIDAMMWMPDGRLVASSANIIQIWNPSTGHCMSTLTGHSGEVTSLALLGASQIVSSGEDHTLKIWDASSSTMNQDHDSGISNVMWSPSGAMIASFGPDSNIGIWDSSTGGRLSTMKQHNEHVTFMAWSRSEKLASTSMDRKIRIWDALADQPLLIIDEGSQFTTPLCWSVDESHLLCGSYDDHTMKSWDTATGECKSSCKLDNLGLYVFWSPDASQFASVSGDSRIMIQNPYTGECSLTLDGYKDAGPCGLITPAVQLAWSSDGTQLVSVRAKTIRVWDLVTGKCTFSKEMDLYPGNLHFPGALPYDEPAVNYLNSSIGGLEIQPSIAGPVDMKSCASAHRPSGLGFSPSFDWITYEGVNIIRLPQEYRPTSASGTMISGATVVIGSVTGRVLILKFDKDRLMRAHAGR